MYLEKNEITEIEILFKETSVKLLNEDGTFDRINDRILEECMKRNINGAFAVADVHRFHTRYGNILTEKPIREGVEGKNDCNFLAVCFSKLAMVIVHRRNTGGETKFIGEVPYMGGRLSKDGQFAYAFSGASQEEDDELMQIAEETHATL